MQALHWEKVPKQYFLGDVPKPCYIEKNPKISGTPLWPRETAFHCKQIEKNIGETRLLLEKAGGVFVSGHVGLSPDRKINATDLVFEKKPRRLKTTFVSGFFIPWNNIQETRIGFYPQEGEIPPLNETVKNSQGTWLLTNLGYFLTQKLISAHNAKHPEGEHLSKNAKGYLGGFFVRKGSEFIGYPPHFGTCGVGITKEGRPILVDRVELKGGSVWFDNTKLDWKKNDVNKDFLFTPAFSTEKPIGEGKVNVVIFNEGGGTYPIPKIAYIKEGAICQPAAGIVFSIEKSLFKKLEVRPDAKVRFEFEPWFDKKVWESFDSFYEGLLKLSSEGVADFEPWLHPNACLTQETYIPNPYRREPRAVLVQTENYFGGITFSGRYEYSIGISFTEMSPFIQKIVEESGIKEKIEKIVSLDGGSGVKLCLVENGKIRPLNWIAPGTRNRMGDPNGNTYSALLLKI